jgi:cytochrome c oxidase subunit 2
MAFIIILGLRSWNELTSGPTKDSEKIELFAEQFQWTARYSGEDNVLGKFDYKLTTGTNGLGLMTKATIDSSISEITNSIQKIELSLKLMHLDHLSSFYRNKVRSSSYKNAVDSVYNTIVKSESFNLVEAEEKLMKMYAKEIDSHGHLTIDVPGPNAETQKLIDKYEDDLIVKGEILRSLIQMKKNHNSKSDGQAWNDIIQKDTLFLCQGREYEMSFRSKDVLHSAYLPHFRVQMNVVPGMPTRFKFTPSLTTKQMRVKKKDSKFNFILMCNKICGTSHYKMKMIVVVYPKKEYQKWMNNKRENTFRDQYFPSEENTEASNTEI